jgi:hypothetical protein
VTQNHPTQCPVGPANTLPGKEGLMRRLMKPGLSRGELTSSEQYISQTCNEQSAVYSSSMMPQPSQSHSGGMFLQTDMSTSIKSSPPLVEVDETIVGGRNPCGVESSFDTKLSGKQILIVTIWHPNNKSLFCLKTILFFYMSGDIQLEDSPSLQTRQTCQAFNRPQGLNFLCLTQV